jgi:hypothetical protein
MPSERELLLKGFDTVRDFFNRHDFTEQSWAEKMEPYLDDNVAMKRLDDPTYHVGKATVKQYFLHGNGKSDEATIAYQNRKDCHIMGDLAFISGFAEFVDQNGTNHNPASNPRRIVYSFVYKKAGDTWKAIYLWGAYVYL